MWKKFWILSVLLLTSLAMAETYIYYPVSGSITDGGTFYIGRVGMGHLMKLIFNAEVPSTIYSVSSDYQINYKISNGRLWVEMRAPSNPGRYGVKLLLDKNTGLETITIAFDVVKKPLNIVTGRNIVAKESFRSPWSLAIMNRGVGYTEVEVWSDFPSEGFRKSIYPHEVVSGSLTFLPMISGDYEAHVYVRDLFSGEIYDEPITIHVKPTMKGRVGSSSHLPDFFLPVLYPVRLLLGVFRWRI